MVVMSMEAFEKMQFESDIYFKLAEAEREAEETGERFSSKDILSEMKAAARRKWCTRLSIYRCQTRYGRRSGHISNIIVQNNNLYFHVIL